jgi:hypothetical protein
VAERYALGQATAVELDVAQDAAQDAACDAADVGVSRIELWYVACAAVFAAKPAGIQAATGAANFLLNATAVTDLDEVRNNQAAWLRANTTPCFKAK